MFKPRTLRIVAIALALLVLISAILGYDATRQRQNIPPAYSPHTLDI